MRVTSFPWNLVLAVAIAACDASTSNPDAGRAVALDAAASCGLPGSSPDTMQCRCASDCVAGAICFTEEGTGFAGGYCARSCADMPCAEGDVCTPGAPTPTCERRCQTAADCGPGRTCLIDGVCFPFCASDAECGSGRCNEHSGLCIAAGAPEPTGLDNFEPCTRDSECLSGLCSNRDGQCFSGCVLSRPSCPSGGVCIGVSGVVSLDFGTCFEPCAPNGACPDGQTCEDAESPAGARYCAPE